MKEEWDGIRQNIRGNQNAISGSGNASVHIYEVGCMPLPLVG
jgi:hypothetical protein